MTEQPPPEAVALAERRAAARADRDFASADRLRAEIEAMGWVVADAAAGFELAPKPPYDVLPSLRDLPDNSAVAAGRRATVSVVVDGWPDDVRACIDALLRHTADDVIVQVLDLGDVDGAGRAAHELAGPRLEEWHVAAAASYSWAAARTALLRADTAAVHIWCEVSTLLTGDAITPLVQMVDGDVVGAGWRGVRVDVDDDWRSCIEAPTGDVDAVLGYLFAMRRDIALAAGGPHPKARYYRNADIEFSFALREAARQAGLAGRMLASPDLPCRQERHHGYHDVDPTYRDVESAKTYNRFLQRFRGRMDLLASS